MCVSSTQLAAPVQLLLQISEAGASSGLVTDQNLATFGGYTQSLKLVQVMQERTLVRGSVPAGGCLCVET